MLTVNSRIAIAENELEERFIHASGPGGQHVNKVATAVQLRFNVACSPSLPDEVRHRLLGAGRHRAPTAPGRITSDGVLIIEASRFRGQDRNREDARQRLVEWIRQAAKRPRRRIPTRPSAAAEQRRLDAKQHRAAVKRQRRGSRDPED